MMEAYWEGFDEVLYVDLEKLTASKTWNIPNIVFRERGTDRVTYELTGVVVNLIEMDGKANVYLSFSGVSHGFRNTNPKFPLGLKVMLYQRTSAGSVKVGDDVSLSAIDLACGTKPYTASGPTDPMLFSIVSGVRIPGATVAMSPC